MWNLAQLMVAVGISPSDGLANLELEHFPFAKSNTAIRTARHQNRPDASLAHRIAGENTCWLPLSMNHPRRFGIDQ
jgi:hypothetical protein